MCWTASGGSSSASTNVLAGLIEFATVRKAAPAAFRNQSERQFLMVMRLTCDRAFSVFGNVTVSTPFL
jgi:hypothetical protein